MNYIVPDDELHPIFKHWRLDDRSNLVMLCGANVKENKQDNRNQETGICCPDSFEYEEDENGERKVKRIESILVIVPQGEKLEDYFDRMPYGIIDKSITGIGATTLELISPRNSIVVVPTKALAYSKYQQRLDPDSRLYQMNVIYVGSSIGADCPRLTDEQINDFIDSSQSKKKIIVVANSLGRVLNSIGKENYKNYFLMVDEVDIIQSDSTFRPALEDVIDYYFEFEPENRCLVSATIKELPHPLLHKEIIITTQYASALPRNISLINTDNPHIILKEKIQEIFDSSNGQKIVIAYNSISYIKHVIALLPSGIRQECAILCSENSEGDAKYVENETGEIVYCFSELTDGHLNKRVTFMTCAYFVGIDILDMFHLISVANAKKLYTLLSVEKIIQIKGRCRPGVLSDTIIYSIKERDEFNREDYKKELEDKANGMLQLYDVARDIGTRTPEIAHFFDKLCEDICEAGKERIPEDNKSVPLTRKSVVSRNYKPSYFNIDSLVEKRWLRHMLYSDANQLRTKLEEQKNWTVAFTIENREATNEQKEIEDRVVEDDKALDLQEIDSLIVKLRDVAVNRTSFVSVPRHIEQLKRGKRRKVVTFLDAFLELWEYVAFDVLITNLKETYGDGRTLRAYKNAVKFWALDNSHPFKEDIIRTFILLSTYTREVIHNKLTRIFRDNSLILPEKERDSIEYLSVFFKLQNLKNNLGERKILRKYHALINEESTPLKVIPIRTNVNSLFEFI